MARKKVGGATPTRRPDATFEKAPRPTLASGPFTVSAQGAILKDDDRLIVVVRVLDADGAPVTGLKKQNFKLWQMGHFFSELNGFFVVEIDSMVGWKAPITWCASLGRWSATARFPSWCGCRRARCAAALR